MAPKTISLPATTSVVHIVVALSASRPKAPRSFEPESSCDASGATSSSRPNSWDNRSTGVNATTRSFGGRSPTTRSRDSDDPRIELVAPTRASRPWAGAVPSFQAVRQREGGRRGQPTTGRRCPIGRRRQWTDTLSAPSPGGHFNEATVATEEGRDPEGICLRPRSMSTTRMGSAR